MKRWINRFENTIQLEHNRLLIQENKKLKKQLKQSMDLIDEGQKLINELNDEAKRYLSQYEQMLSENISLTKMLNSIIK